MKARWLVAALVLVAIVEGAQYSHRGRRWEMYEPEMQDPADDPPDAWVEAEFAFARLRFRSYQDAWRRGHARWGTDANKSERQFILGLRRLTRIDARSVEQIVDIDSDEIFDWPLIYGVGIGDWTLSESHVERLRKYFQRGGFLIVDDFHGPREWRDFMDGIERIFPDNYSVVELEPDDAIFHTVYDLAHRERVPGYNVVHGSMIERGGIVPHWRGVVDPEGRVHVGIFFNQDLGDAWEWADDHYYPEKYASTAYRLGVNYVIYAMTR